MDIYGLEYNDNSGKQPWSYVYLHGMLEDMNGYDLCYTNDKKPTENTKKSVKIHIKDKTIYGTLFYWYEKGNPQGIVVADDDIKGYFDALKKWYENNPNYIS